MRELTIEEKAKAYDEAIQQLRSMMPNWEHLSYNGKTFLQDLIYIFPALKENEDEKIRKELIEQVIYIVPDKNEVDDNGNTLPCYTTRINKYITWLKKQEFVREIVERCKNSWYNEGKIQGQIEVLSDDEKYQQGWHDALEKQDVIEKQCEQLDASIRNIATNNYEEGKQDVLDNLEKYGLVKQELSKEDKERIQRIYTFLWKNRKGDTDTIYQIENDAEWLKNLNTKYSLIK